jgi:hypothetical protein
MPRHLQQTGQYLLRQQHKGLVAQTVLGDVVGTRLGFLAGIVSLVTLPPPNHDYPHGNR